MSELEALKPKEEQPAPHHIEDFGLHYPVEYVSRVLDILELSNFVTWPEAGGLNHQDSFLIDDVLTLSRLKRRIRWEIENGYQEHEEQVVEGIKPKRL